MGNNGPADDVEEKEHFQRIVNAFRYYRFGQPFTVRWSSLRPFGVSCFYFRSFSLQRLAASETYVSTLPVHHQKLLTSYRSHLEDIRTCVEHNYEIIKLITADVATLFENVKHDAGQVCFSSYCLKKLILLICKIHRSSLKFIPPWVIWRRSNQHWSKLSEIGVKMVNKKEQHVMTLSLKKLNSNSHLLKGLLYYL